MLNGYLWSAPDFMLRALIIPQGSHYRVRKNRKGKRKSAGSPDDPTAKQLKIGVAAIASTD